MFGVCVLWGSCWYLRCGWFEFDCLMLGVVVCCLVVWSGVRVVLSLLVWCLVNSVVVVYAFG